MNYEKTLTADCFTRQEVWEHLLSCGWFQGPGAYVLVDGQFGSTGKGLLASLLAEVGHTAITHVTTNAGPNSGHTAYSPVTGERFMTQQIPVGAVVLQQLARRDALQAPLAYLNAGAIIDPEILRREAMEHQFSQANLWAHPNAAVIKQQDRDAEAEGSIAAVASTGKGVGAALARKIRREGNILAQEDGSHRWGRRSLNWYWLSPASPPDCDDPDRVTPTMAARRPDTVLVETAQGFSLGINGQFYPHTTSRECTVMQAIADARIPYNKVRKVAACYRTFPIRVGNTQFGHSGGCYHDQQETTWDKIGVEPELTSVTRRVRRVFTWSREQFRESVAANQPDLLFINFMNYLPDYEHYRFLDVMMEDYRQVMGKDPETVLLGYGPRNGDVRLAPQWVP